MPSIYKHTRGNTRYWIAVFSDETGRQRHRSTKTVNRAEAMACAERFQRLADKVRKQCEKTGENHTPNSGLILESFLAAAQKLNEGSFTEHDGREVINQILRASGRTPHGTATVRSFLLDWAASKAISRTSGTATRYRHTVESFIGFLGARADQSITSVSPQDVQKFRDLQLGEGKSATTANMVVKTIRIPLNLARRQGLILTNPAEAVDMIEAEGAERDVFSPKQIQQLLKAADTEWKGMILVGACAGLRIGDAAKLTWENIDFETMMLRYSPAKTSKGGKRRFVEAPILHDLEEYLLNLRVSERVMESPVFPRLSKKPVSGVAGLSQLFLALMEEAGVDKKTIVTRAKGSKGRSFNALTFHSLRHTFISTMANIGVAEEIRMKISGHTSDVHKRYTHHERTTLKRSLEKFPSYTGGKA
jgi:integrase